eukprot:g13376.t1 g13376   contig8:549345-549707(+)
MEDEVLVALGWRLSDPTALGFANHAIALLGKVVVCGSSRSKTSSRISSVVDFTRLQIELAICDYRTSVLHKPSTIALASVMNSMGLLDFTTAERRCSPEPYKTSPGWKYVVQWYDSVDWN